MTGIGSLNEKPLHALLKEWYAGPGDRSEVPVDGFVIDIVRKDLLVEIQTRSFASIKRKLLRLLRAHRVRLVYPVAHEKWLIKLQRDDEAEIEAPRRRSPKRGRIEDVFREMVSLPDLIVHPGFSLEVLFTREEEVRRYDPRRTWRRGGWVTVDRRLVEVVGRRVLEGPGDWRALVPAMSSESFTAKDLAAALGIRRDLAQKIVYCLCRAKVIPLVGKHGKENVYGVSWQR
jgi:hypothetical protein